MPCTVGLKTRCGLVSVPVPATHCQLRLFWRGRRREEVEEVAGARPPVDVQVLGEERRHDQPGAVVHRSPPGQELAHAGVDDRVAGAALLPGASRVGVVAPVVAAVAVVGPGGVGTGGEDLAEEVAPAELADERVGRRPGDGRRRAPPRAVRRSRSGGTATGATWRRRAGRRGGRRRSRRCDSIQASSRSCAAVAAAGHDVGARSPSTRSASAGSAPGSTPRAVRRRFGARARG